MEGVVARAENLFTSDSEGEAKPSKFRKKIGRGRQMLRNVGEGLSKAEKKANAMANVKQYGIMGKYAKAYLARRHEQLSRLHNLPPLHFLDLAHVFRALASEYNSRESFVNGETRALKAYNPLEKFYENPGTEAVAEAYLP
eukprot:NODE_479_length_6970_cov_0.750982.p6 type:complete len:141 gc:universal NODE_479_length_6970_cov_0.750982:1280-858(-)